MPKIIYDGNCPFCANYVAKLQLERSIGQVELIDARQNSAMAANLRQQGYDLDQGMLFILDDNYYFGDDALHRLALLSSGSDWFNRLNRYLFCISWLAALLYPLLRLGRNLTLSGLGRSAISAPAQDHQALSILFNIVWAAFCILHVFVYSTQFDRASFITSVGISIFAVMLLFKPRSKILFIGLLLVSSLSALLQMPVSSNHSLIKNFFLLSALLLGTYHALRGHNWALFSQQLSYAGRGLLLIMYFYGVFHKINSDFLNPDVSCAVALWRDMPYFLSWLDYNLIHYLTIYGTLIGETFIAICLLVPKWRHLGIVSGMAFHALLALSGYAMYPPFSTLCIALHCCFLAPQAAQRIVLATEWQKLRLWLKTLLGKSTFAFLLLMLFSTAWTHSYNAFGLVWLIFTVPFIYVVAKYGNAPATAPLRSDKASKLILTSVIGLFFINAATPYLGLKTAQSLNMFANLRLEAGLSNHLVFSAPPGPWQYLDDVVTVDNSGGIAELEYIKSKKLGIVYYQLLHYLQLNPSSEVDFSRAGKRYRQQSALTLKADIDQILHPLWVRKVFHFNVVDFTDPKPCALDR